MKNKMKEVRLRYNDQDDLKSLIICVEAYLYEIAESQNIISGLENIRIVEVENRDTGIRLNILVRQTKTGIVISEVKKASHIKDN